MLTKIFCDPHFLLKSKWFPVSAVWDIDSFRIVRLTHSCRSWAHQPGSITPCHPASIAHASNTFFCVKKGKPRKATKISRYWKLHLCWWRCLYFHGMGCSFWYMFHFGLPQFTPSEMQSDIPSKARCMVASHTAPTTSEKKLVPPSSIKKVIQTSVRCFFWLWSDDPDAS